MANKRKPAQQKLRPISIALSPELLRKSQRLAFVLDKSLSRLVRDLLVEKLEAAQ